LNRHLVLKDREDNELLRLEELAPPEEYRRFLDAVPAWTGRPVEQETDLR